MTRAKFDLWFWRLFPIAGLIIVVIVFAWERHRHRMARLQPVTVGTEIVTHRDAVREAGRQLKEELAKQPDSAITSKTNEAQILIAYGRKLKELAEAKKELAMLKGDLANGATAEAKYP